jgi:hypothetical protein
MSPSYKAAMSAPIKRDECPYCTSDNEAVRSTFCNATCAGCLSRHFEKPIPTKPTLWQRIREWLCAIFWVSP